MKESKNFEKTQKMTGFGVKFYEKNNDPVLKGKDWYKKNIVEMVSRIENEIMLKKIYTFAKTLNDISKEEGV